MKMLKKKQQQAAIGLLPFFLLLSIAALGQGMPQVLRSDSKVALVNYTYLQNESEAMRNIQAVQKGQWQTLRQTMKTDKANIDTVSNVARKEQMLSAYANSYKKKTDDLRHAHEQQLKELKLNIEANVKAVAAEEGYTEIRDTADSNMKSTNNITEKVLKRLNQ
jgi:hypothetical protein